MRNYVLGSGLAGLITGFITGWTVIGDKVGGQHSLEINLGPRILERTMASQRFISSLGIWTPARKFNIGYAKYGRYGFEGVLDQPELGFRELYLEKTRGLTSNITSSLSDNKRSIIGWDINELGLVEILVDRINLIQGRVCKIDTDNKYLYTQNEAARYYNLISTIPLPILGRVTGLPVPECIAIETNFIVGRMYSNYLSYFQDFDYVYVADMLVPYHRVTKLDKKGLFVAESKLGAERQMENLFSSVNTVITVKDCQIIKNIGMDTFQDIILSGRYARWTQSEKLEHVVERAYAIRDSEV